MHLAEPIEAHGPEFAPTTDGISNTRRVSTDGTAREDEIENNPVQPGVNDTMQHVESTSSWIVSCAKD